MKFTTMNGHRWETEESALRSVELGKECVRATRTDGHLADRVTAWVVIDTIAFIEES